MFSAATHPAVANPYFTLLMAAFMFANQVLKLRHQAAAIVTATTLVTFALSPWSPARTARCRSR